MDISLKTILAGIRDGKIAPCYLLYGDEDYLISDGLNQIISSLLPEGHNDLNLMRIDGDSEDIGMTVETILTPSLLGGRKVVVVHDTHLFHSKKTGAQLVQSVRDNLEYEPRRAVQAFMSFLDAAGWTLSDLRDGGWKKIPASAWQTFLDGESPREMEEWLPRVIALCDEMSLSDRKLSRDTERLEEAVAGKLPAGNCLVLTARTVDRRKKLFKIIADMEGALACEKSKKEGEQKAAFIGTMQNITAKAGKKMSREALEVLGGKTGYDLTASASEIEKLIAWTGKRTAIEKGDVEEVVTKSKEETVFTLVSALINKDVNLTLNMLRYLQDQGVHALQILSMIARELRLLLQAKMLIESKAVTSFTAETGFPKFQSSIYPQVKEQALFPGKKGSTLSGLHPYVAYNIFRNAARFSFDDLFGYFHRLAAFDVAVKTTGIDPERALQRIVIDMCSSTSTDA
ncbi:MAG: DNA polymerase III subunit delta [Deltaproteobacteria bacterium]|nr:DNA polymerase III subunit delta [Deltaproteobacteria bacterium]